MYKAGLCLLFLDTILSHILVHVLNKMDELEEASPTVPQLSLQWDDVSWMTGSAILLVPTF